MFDKLKYISFFVLLSVGVFSSASASEIIDQEFTTGTSSVSLEDRTGSGGEYANLDTVFERVITLGDCCATKAYVNLYFKEKYGEENNKYIGGYLFDWMVPRDLGKLADAISQHLIDVVSPNMTVIHEQPWGGTGVGVVCNRYDMIFNHLFDGHPKIGHYDFQNKTILNQSLFDNHYDDIKDKFNYLTKKTLSGFVKGEDLKKTLYVFFGVSISKIDTFTKENILKLRNSIKSLREDSDFILLFINQQTFDFEDFENVLFRKVSFPWSVSSQASIEWKKIFDEFSFVKC